MVLFNYSTKELTAKIVYYGPGLCGKTTNLQFIYDSLPEGKKGKMLSLATQTDRTLYFDFLPVELGDIRGLKTRVQLYTVPGQVFYNETRKMVLKGVDGVVFVADSQTQMADANLESFANLEDNLKVHGLDPATVPLVLQFNKRDLPSTVAVEDMNAALNRFNAPFYEAIATTGIGVHDTLKAITKLVLLSLSERYGDDSQAVRKEAAAPAPRVQPPPRVPPPPPRQAARKEPTAPAPSPAWQNDELDLELDRMDAIEIEGLLEEVEAFDRAPHAAAPAAPAATRSGLPPLGRDFEFGLPEEDEAPARPQGSDRNALSLDADLGENEPELAATPAGETEDWLSWRPEGGSVLPDDLDGEAPTPAVAQPLAATPDDGDLFVPLAEGDTTPVWDDPAPSPAPQANAAASAKAALSGTASLPVEAGETPLPPLPASLVDGGVLRLPLRLEIGGRTVSRVLTVRLEPEHDGDPPRR